jgi:predicted membrane channel-forming protein YqfA (hemolysin III family)
MGMKTKDRINYWLNDHSEALKFWVWFLVAFGWVMVLSGHPIIGVVAIAPVFLLIVAGVWLNN